jgi:hypothetical protein
MGERENDLYVSNISFTGIVSNRFKIDDIDPPEIDPLSSITELLTLLTVPYLFCSAEINKYVPRSLGRES